jgi:hypothetical protein
MIVPAIYVGNGIASATVPSTQLLIGPVQAWVLILTLLALCCGILWAVTRPVGTEEATAWHRRSRRTVANEPLGTALASRGQQVRRPMPLVSQSSTDSLPSFNAAASMSDTGGIAA